MFSRLGSPPLPERPLPAPRRWRWRPDQPLHCPVCGAVFYGPAAEDLAFNSGGACRKCGGTGVVRTVDLSTLVPDETLTIDEGAVAPWNSLMWSLMTDVCRAMGVRTDVPFKDLTPEEKEIVYHGPAVKKHILYQPKNGGQGGELDFTYYSAVHTVENALAKVKDEKGMKRVEKFLREDACPDCGGTRMSDGGPGARSCGGFRWTEACQMTLSDLERVGGRGAGVPAGGDAADGGEHLRLLPGHRPAVCWTWGWVICPSTGPASTLSTGERQRMQLARAVRNRTTGVFYVLDEPSIGLHPAEHRRPHRGDGRPDCRRQLRAAGGPRHADPVGRPTG